jgi:hypothetical protein
VSWAIYYSSRAERDCEGLPDEALAALGEVEAQLTEHPFLGDSNPSNRLERSIDFGKLGQGVITYVLDEQLEEIWLLGIVWF